MSKVSSSVAVAVVAVAVSIGAAAVAYREWNRVRVLRKNLSDERAGRTKAERALRERLQVWQLTANFPLTLFFSGAARFARAHISANRLC